MTLDVEVLAVLFNFLALKVVVHNPALADLGQGGQGRVLSDVLQQVQTVALTILGGVGETCVNRGLHVGHLDFLALDEHLAGDVGTVRVAEDGHGHLGTTRTHQTRQTDDLAGMHVDVRMVYDHALRVERMMHGPILDTQVFLARGIGGVVRVQVVQRTTHHLADEFFLVERRLRRHVHHTDGRTVSNDGDIVGNGGDLVEFMSDDDAGHALLVT